ncbi:phasin protein [Aliiruegeria haliotis]|uniref:Phasin protein n=1 Tax=Aliiruegeria haliotis TaxID=1280846 RepID=A0A2T0RW31_9RHOB|nr:hypothetical protein [Aliiruegeria haliotis]PRY25399.1 phasin protein [Aliiruegeria haliotis]
MTADANWARDMPMVRGGEVFAHWQRIGVAAFGWPNPVWVQQMADMSAEVAQFISDRIREDLRTQSELLDCDNPVEMREIQGRFLKTAFDQYSAETGKLVRMNRCAIDALLGRNSGG